MAIELSPHPSHVVVATQRAKSVQLRAADAITTFAGSMAFVYIHAVIFAGWIALKVEAFPFGLLTMIVSLEAIFLSTFVMIGQNRQAQLAAVKDAHDYETQTKQLSYNTELTETVHTLVTAIHSKVVS
jgi:uncharacterized membrane protein